ncbi:heme NO-binding domain-containing protein [Caldisalinibacter kiritimatiensis]|uniref:Methyl-accepting chemotaxis protein n=1 Tax=Caldisalinibacter kiritimatiensis TaxID=1304284 RepID=R1AYE1_9FIRM|nr:heme NO-binding domain-containing protein [Caldisalinibacter kiritimatiensis]EOD01707.1 Methyl-accepting chemotaxis protein [Caldisalinibacter kiritimatiensis]
MKGTIVSAWIKTCKKLYGEVLTEEAMKAAGLEPNKLFKPTEDVEDSVAKKMVEYIAEKQKKTTYDVWKEIGYDNIVTFSNDYPAFFEHRNLYSFLKSMYDVHVVVAKRIPGANPPILKIKAISKNKAEMTYKSSRKMFGYFNGILEGAANFYGEKIEVKTIDQKDDFIKIHITFEDKIYNYKSYKINKLLSLGFIKKFEGKLAVASLLFIGVPYVIASNFLDTNVTTGVTLALTVLVPYIFGKLMLLPKRNIISQLKDLKENNYVEENEIATNDFFEDINKLINEYKDIIKSDFVGFKGLTDELHVFSNTFNEISANMNTTSKEISEVVEQVAQGAVDQADQTESAAYLLNNNISTLNQIVDNENKSKDDLENVVEKINEGFKELKDSSNSLRNVLNQFSKVKEDSFSLQNRAKDVTKIVETVEAIAEQTNLLALNAAIEASRAGEFGRGFSVVAEEIRQLAEESKNAVKSINENLVSFINEINSLVENIESQYSVLEGENQRLSVVADNSSASVNDIQNVSNSLIQMIEQLTKETEAINQVSQNIESLAAIAEENSASSEEVSSNVTTYASELQRMIENIEEFQKVSEEFKKDLTKYKI